MTLGHFSEDPNPEDCVSQPMFPIAFEYDVKGNRVEIF